MSTRVKPRSSGAAARALSMRFKIGSKNAAVLPVPVSAHPIKSLPSMTIGMTAL
jgi:hypothetical protein